MLFALSLTALAAPDRIAADLTDAGGTSLSWMVVDDANQLVAVIDDGSSQLRVVDLQTWETQPLSVCDAPRGLATWAIDDVAYFAVGCTTGEADIIAVVDRQASISDTLAISDAPLLGLAYSSETLWGVVDDADGLAIEGVLPADGSLSEVTSTLARSGFTDVLGATSYVFVLHGDDDISKFHAETGGTTASNENLGGRDFVDAKPQLGNDTNLFLADAEGGLLQYQSASDELAIVIDSTDGLSATQSLAIDVDGEWMALGDGTDVQLHVYEDGGVTESPFDSFSLDGEVALELGATDGYLFAATDGGRLLVLTENPWVQFDAAPAGLVDGDTFVLSFTSDTAGDWTMRLGGPAGSELASGTIEADATGAAEFEVDDVWDEGDNRVWVTVGEGYDAVDVTVDNPPPRAEIEVGFGDSKILVDITAAGVSDLASYQVYVSTEAFTADDYPSGGPEDAEMGWPLTVTSEDPDADVSTTVDGLTNGVTYHVAVRVVDEAGTEGEMSEVYAVTPEETYGAAFLAGESSCSHTPIAPLGLLGAAALLLIRRRRLSAGLALGAGLLVAAPAEAAETEGWKAKSRTNEVHVGSMSMEDPQNTTSNEAWADTYGQSGLTYLRVDGGRQLYRVLELNGGVGLVRKGGYLVSASGATSTESGKITALPISAGLTLRLDPTARIKDEWRGMPIVPYVGAGLDYTLWRERLGDIDIENPTDNEVYSGGSPGWHWSVGADILLDWMDPKRASMAEARWGIKDSYLTIEYNNRSTIYPSGVEGLSFAGDSLTVGIKVDRK